MPFVAFPGQGSQRVGMARTAASRSPRAAAVIDEASFVLNVDMRHLLWHGDAATLKRTENAQPAIVAASIAVYRCWEMESGGGTDIDWVSGHSVGALTAAIASGAMTFEHGIALTGRRGQLMADAPGDGGMIAIAVTSQSSLERAIEVGKRAGLSLACRNGDRQLVLSGDVAGVRAVHDELGARSSVVDVSHGFHSPLMDPVIADWTSAVAESVIIDPRVPYLSSRTGKALHGGADVALDLIESLRYPVRWDLVGDVADATGRGVIVGEGASLARMWRGRSASKHVQVYSGEGSSIRA